MSRLTYDAFRVLDLPRTATSVEIKKQYYKLSREHHPDKGGNHETMALLNQAYEILCDPVRKLRPLFSHQPSTPNPPPNQHKQTPPKPKPPPPPPTPIRPPTAFMVTLSKIRDQPLASLRSAFRTEFTFTWKNTTPHIVTFSIYYRKKGTAVYRQCWNGPGNVLGATVLLQHQECGEYEFFIKSHSKVVDSPPVITSYHIYVASVRPFVRRFDDLKNNTDSSINTSIVFLNSETQLLQALQVRTTDESISKSKLLALMHSAIDVKLKEWNSKLSQLSAIILNSSNTMLDVDWKLIDSREWRTLKPPWAPKWKYFIFSIGVDGKDGVLDKLTGDSVRSHISALIRQGVKQLKIHDEFTLDEQYLDRFMNVYSGRVPVVGWKPFLAIWDIILTVQAQQNSFGCSSGDWSIAIEEWLDLCTTAVGALKDEMVSMMNTTIEKLTSRDLQASIEELSQTPAFQVAVKELEAKGAKFKLFKKQYSFPKPNEHIPGHRNVIGVQNGPSTMNSLPSFTFAETTSVPELKPHPPQTSSVPFSLTTKISPKPNKKRTKMDGFASEIRSLQPAFGQTSEFTAAATASIPIQNLKSDKVFGSSSQTASSSQPVFVFGSTGSTNTQLPQPNLKTPPVHSPTPFVFGHQQSNKFEFNKPLPTFQETFGTKSTQNMPTATKPGSSFVFGTGSVPFSQPFIFGQAAPPSALPTFVNGLSSGASGASGATLKPSEKDAPYVFGTTSSLGFNFNLPTTPSSSSFAQHANHMNVFSFVSNQATTNQPSPKNHKSTPYSSNYKFTWTA